VSHKPGSALITSCEECRAQFEKDQKDSKRKLSLPCDIGKPCKFGLVELFPENRLALNLYLKIKKLGWDIVSSLKPLGLTPDEGELLLEKFSIIQDAFDECAKVNVKTKSIKKEKDGKTTTTRHKNR
jgi:hypothetical protein